MTDQGHGQVVLITGASQGIGRHIALAFADVGSTLALAARNVAGLDKTRSLIEQRGARAVVVPTDVSEAGQVNEMAEAVVGELGRIDVLVCNSGIAGPTAPLWEISPEQWHETLQVNATGVFLCCRAVLPSMIARGNGSVVVIGSMTGKRPLHGRTPYATSKLGLVGLVRTLSVEAGPYGVRVNLLSPGPVEGERIEGVIEAQARALDIPIAQARARFTQDSPLGRLTPPDDVAACAVFLASPAAASITGEDMNVSAGVAMH
jgi:NAD(P)-dependent dehydrogenase (short-subunit alcohol dehydrogenase family)